MRLIGLFGGTFDPIHCGHLRLAIEARERLGLDEVLFLPAGQPRLRGAPLAPQPTRRRLLELALEGLPGMHLDVRELERPGPTATVDTLEELHAERSGDALCLLLGSDAFSRLERWTRWRRLMELAHLVVALRPGAVLPQQGPVARLLARAAEEPAVLRTRPAGCVFLMDIPALDISATRVRELLATGRDARFLVPDRALSYLLDEGIYRNEQLRTR